MGKSKRKQSTTTGGQENPRASNPRAHPYSTRFRAVTRETMGQAQAVTRGSQARAGPKHPAGERTAQATQRPSMVTRARGGATATGPPGKPTERGNEHAAVTTPSGSKKGAAKGRKASATHASKKAKTTVPKQAATLVSVGQPGAKADSAAYRLEQGLVLSAAEQARIREAMPTGEFEELLQGTVTTEGLETVIDDLFEESPADKRHAALVERFRAYVAERDRKDQKAKRGSAAARGVQFCFEFFEEAGAEKGRRTRNLQCDTQDCKEQKCCPREYAASTVEKQGRALAGAEADIGALAKVFGSSEWSKLMGRFQRRQVKNGRTAVKAAPIFQHDLEELMLESDTMVSAAESENEAMTAVKGAQAASTIAADTETGRRTMDISKITTKEVSFVDRHVPGREQILLGLVDTKHPIPNDMVLLRCRCSADRDPADWDRTCAVCWIERYIRLMAEYGIVIGAPESGPFLFPFIFSNSGNGGFPQVGRGRRHGDTVYNKFEHAPTDHAARWMKKATERAGIDTEYTPHGSRGAVAVVSLALGKSPRAINQAQGWAPNSKQFKTYGRLLQQQAMSKQPIINAGDVSAFLGKKWTGFA